MVSRIYEVEGLPVGPSSGAALYATLQVEEKAERGVCVTVFPDGRERHLSSFLDYNQKRGNPT